jgi:hypothetical protein
MLPMSDGAVDPAPAGALHDIPPDSGDAVLAAFDPGTDHCTLTVDTWDSEIVLTGDADGALLTFTNAADAIVSVRFPGLSEVPVDSITLCVDAAGEAGAATFSLSEVFVEVEGNDEGRDDTAAGDADGLSFVLSPTDPDAPDDLPDPLDNVVPLGPVDPDLPDLTPTDPWDGEVLSPVVEDDALQGGILIRGDPASGAPVPAVIEGFDAGDQLSISLSPLAFPGPLEVTVMPAGSGAGTAVLVDGQPVAIVSGPAAPDAGQVHVSLAERISR